MGDESATPRLGRPLKGTAVRNAPLAARVEPWVIAVIDAAKQTCDQGKQESRADVLTRWALEHAERDSSSEAQRP